MTDFAPNFGDAALVSPDNAAIVKVRNAAGDVAVATITGTTETGECRADIQVVL